MAFFTEKMQWMSAGVLLCTLFSGIASTVGIALPGLTATCMLKRLIQLWKLMREEREECMYVWVRERERERAHVQGYIRQQTMYYVSQFVRNSLKLSLEHCNWLACTRSFNSTLANRKHLWQQLLDFNHEWRGWKPLHQTTMHTLLQTCTCHMIACIPSIVYNALCMDTQYSTLCVGVWLVILYKFIWCETFIFIEMARHSYFKKASFRWTTGQSALRNY